MIIAYNIFIGKTGGQSSLGKPGHRREDNVRRDLDEIVWGSVECIHLVQDMNQWQS
jgi:hypothetical protein